MNREIDTFIEGLQRDWYRRVKPVKKAEPKPEAEEGSETSGPSPQDAAALLRERHRKRRKRTPVPGAMNEAISSDQTETKDAD